MAELDQLNVSTRRYIRDNPALIDNVFNNDPLLAYLKLNTREDFDGGSLIQEGFYFDGLIGGSYLKGKEFDISEKQVEQAYQLQMRFYEVNVTLSKEDIQVLNRGPQAVFRLVDSRMTNAYMALGAHIAISLYMAQLGPAGTVSGVTGLAEALNDGSTVSWDNNTYATYGGITRGGQVGKALNSVPTNVNGTIEYPTLEETYGNASYGNVEPNLGLTTVFGYSLIKEKFQTQQRFNDTQDPAIGFNGMKFNSATLIKSRYAPGTGGTTALGVASTGSDANKIAVTYITNATGGALTAYPTLAVSSSETLFWINARKPYIYLYISDDPEYGFGFTGFKPAQGNTKVAGQVLASIQMTTQPRYHAQIYGITG